MDVSDVINCDVDNDGSLVKVTNPKTDGFFKPITNEYLAE